MSRSVEPAVPPPAGDHPRVGRDTVLDVWAVLRCLHVGMVVRHRDGSVCTVESFDPSRGRRDMPVVFKRLCGGGPFKGLLIDVAGMLVAADTGKW